MSKFIPIIFGGILLYTSIIQANDLKVTKGVSPAQNGKYPIGKNIPLTVEIKNDGSSPLPASSWYLGYIIKNQSGQVVYTNSLDGPAIGANETKAITFPNGFMPTGSESYTIIFYLDYPYDSNTSNNSVEYYFSTYGKPLTPFFKSPTNGATGITPNPSPTLTFEQSTTSGVTPVVTETSVYLGPTPESIDPNISQPVTKTAAELKSYTYPWPLDANTKYYSTVIYGNAVGTSKSPDISFTTGSTQYQPANLLSPPNNATDVPANPVELYWNDPTNALSVDIYLGTTVESVTPNVGIPYTHSLPTNLGSFTIPSNALQKNKSYLWRIVEHFQNTYSMSKINKFTTNNKWYPNPPDIKNPKNGETNVPTNVEFKTETIPMKDTDYILALFVGPTVESVCPDQGHPVSQSLNVYSMTYTPSINLLPNSDYYTRTAIYEASTSGALLKSAGLYFPGKRIQFRTGAGPVSVKENKIVIPDEFHLSQNYPNPFNPTTKIKFGLPSSKGNNIYHVELTIYDVLGKIVDRLLDEEMNPGTYEVEFNASHLSSGIYFYQLKAGDFVKSIKMILMK